MSTRQDPEAANAAGIASDDTGSGEGTGSGDTGSGDTGSDEGTGSGDTGSGDTGAERGASAAGKVRAWCAGRLPADWFPAPPDIQVDREEITIVGTLPDPAAAGDSDVERAAAAEDRIRRFREETRFRRIEIAREVEQIGRAHV